MIADTPMSSAEASNPDRIDISVPLRPEFASTLRTLTVSIGADAGFSVDELDDVRLALSEVFSVLADGAGGDNRVLVSLVVTDGELVISLRSDHADTTFELDPLAASILHSVTDGYEIGPRSVAFTKRRVELGADPQRP